MQACRPTCLQALELLRYPSLRSRATSLPACASLERARSLLSCHASWPSLPLLASVRSSASSVRRTLRSDHEVISTSDALPPRGVTPPRVASFATSPRHSTPWWHHILTLFSSLPPRGVVEDPSPTPRVLVATPRVLPSTPRVLLAHSSCVLEALRALLEPLLDEVVPTSATCVAAVRLLDVRLPR